MTNQPTDADDEMVKRGLIGCTSTLNIPIIGCHAKLTIDPLWLLEFLHKNAKDIKSIEVMFTERSIQIVHHDKKITPFNSK